MAIGDKCSTSSHHSQGDVISQQGMCVYNVYMYVYVFMYICDRFWENRPKSGKQFFSVSPGKALWGQFFSKIFLWQKWIDTS